MPRQIALVMAFWLALWLPGHAVVRRWLPEMLQGGLLSTVALSYLASFALLSPISLIGYESDLRSHPLSSGSNRRSRSSRSTPACSD